MRLFIAIVLSTTSFLTSFAQTAKQEINSQVWKPFIEAYNNFDTEKFMSVYSKSVVRVPADQGRVFDFVEYKRNVNRENQFNKNYKIKAALAVKFTKRIHTSDLAYETGILQIKLTDNNGKPATIYTKFQVVLRKENGTWKIQFDTDSTESNTVTESDFNKAENLE